MKNEPTLFSNMQVLDWLLAGVFTVVVALLVNAIFPPYGWLIGIVVALGLLYLAKHRRDRLQHPPDEE